MSRQRSMCGLSHRQLAKAPAFLQLLTGDPRLKTAELLRYFSSFSSQGATQGATQGAPTPAAVHLVPNLISPSSRVASSISVPLQHACRPSSCKASNQTASTQTSAMAWTSLLSTSSSSLIPDGSGSSSACLHGSSLPWNSSSIAQQAASSAWPSWNTTSSCNSLKLRELQEDLSLSALWSSSSSFVQAAAEAGFRPAGSSGTPASTSGQPAGSLSQASDRVGGSSGGSSSDGSRATGGQHPTGAGAGAGAGDGAGGGGGGGKGGPESSSSSSGGSREEASGRSSEGGDGSSGGGSSKDSGEKASGQRSRWTRTGPVSWLSLALLLITGGGLLLYFDSEKKKRMSAVKEGPAVGQAAIGGPFALIRHDGKPVTEKDFMGNWTLLYFGFTHCPDICPAELTKLAAALDKVDATGLRITPVFISVDPERDTVELVKEYVEQYHPRLVGLTGSPEAVRQMARAFRVYYMKTNEGGDDYLVDHSIIMYLMDPNMQFVKFFAKNETIDSLAEGIVKHVREWKA